MEIADLLSWLSAFILWTTLSSLATGAPSGGYKLISVRNFADGRGLVASLQFVGKIYENYGPGVQALQLTVLYETNDRLRVHITDSSHSRWEIPQSVIPRENDFTDLSSLPEDSHASELVAHAFNHALEFSYISHPFGFAVTRRSTGEVLFNSTPPSYSADDGSPLFNSLVYKDQYLELSTQLQKNSIHPIVSYLLESRGLGKPQGGPLTCSHGACDGVVNN